MPNGILNRFVATPREIHLTAAKAALDDAKKIQDQNTSTIRFLIKEGKDALKASQRPKRRSQ